MSSADANLRANVRGRVDVWLDAAPTSANVGGNVGRPPHNRSCWRSATTSCNLPCSFPSTHPVSWFVRSSLWSNRWHPFGVVDWRASTSKRRKDRVVDHRERGKCRRGRGQRTFAARFPTLPFDSASGQFHWESSGGLIVFEIPVQLVGTFFLAPTTGNGGTVHVCCDCGLGAYWAFDKGSGANGALTVFAIPDDVSGLALNYSCTATGGRFRYGYFWFSMATRKLGGFLFIPKHFNGCPFRDCRFDTTITQARYVSV